jgi:hypothetical protein
MPSDARAKAADTKRAKTQPAKIVKALRKRGQG